MPITPWVDVVMTGVHQADYLGQLAVAQMAVAAKQDRPFFIHVTPTIVHEGTCLGPYADEAQYARDDPYWERNLTAFGCPDTGADHNCAMTMSPCPSDRHAHSADGLANPRVPSWNATAAASCPSG